MATIKERIDNVTEDVKLGKTDIINAINSKNARNVSILDTDFSIIADGVNQLNIEKVNPPEISFDADTSQLTLTNKTVGATNYYRKYNSSTWIEYTAPVVVTEDEYYFYAGKTGSIDSDIISEVLEDNRGVLFANINITLNNNSSYLRDYNGVIEIYTTPPILNIDEYVDYVCERSIAANTQGAWRTNEDFYTESTRLDDIKIVVSGFSGNIINIMADAVHITSAGTYHLGSGYISGDNINITGTIT